MVFHTAYFTEEEARPLAEASGADRVVAYGADPGALLAAVRDALAARQPPPRPASPEDFARDHLGAFTAKLLEKVKTLAASERRTRSMAETAPVGIVYGHAGGAATYVNPRLVEISHWDAARLLGQGWLACTSPEHRAEVLALVGGGTGRSTYACHNRVLLGDGEQHWLNVGVQLLYDEDGGADGFMVTVDDVTAVVDAQQRLAEERRERARQSSRQVSERLASLTRMAGGVAHDFNNMLGIIVNYEQFIREGLIAAARDGRMDQATYQETLSDLDRIANAAQRATGLTQQLLAFSGRKVREPALLDLNQTVRETVDVLGRTLDPPVRILTRLRSGLPGIVADPGQISQVLVNLARNAAEATPEGGTISITSEVVMLPTDRGPATVPGPDLPDGLYVKLSVQDTGEGMTPEVAEHAIEPFFTTRALAHAAGMGLATVHGIVNQSGGDLVIDTAPGVGTTVSVYLPCAEQPPPVPEKPTATPGGTETILVVDDEEGICDATARMLRKAGYQVLTAYGGPEALAVASRHPGAIELLLTDVRMPGLSGVELADRLRAARPGLPVLLISGYAGSLAGGGKDMPIVPKPFTERQLLAAVHGLLAPAGANAS